MWGPADWVRPDIAGPYSVSFESDQSFQAPPAANGFPSFFFNDWWGPSEWLSFLILHPR
jgi:hypothetical protein